MKLVMNETRKGILHALEESNTPMTLREISDKCGKSVKSGSINTLVSAGVIKVTGVKKVPVVTYREVNVYAIDDLSALEEKETDEKKVTVEK